MPQEVVESRWNLKIDWLLELMDQNDHKRDE
jgi:hypothetical protein